MANEEEGEGVTHAGVNERWPKTVRLEAAAVCDWRRAFAPGALLVRVEGPRKLRVLEVGTPGDVAKHPANAGASVERHPEAVLMPGLVNAHAHLDLTHIGPRRFEVEKGFGGFVDVVRRERRTEPAEIAASVRLGVEKCLASGVVAVGDIAGAVRGRASAAGVEALAGAALGGVSYIEFFAIGKGEEAGMEGMKAALAGVDVERGVWRKVGISPHAANTVSRRGFGLAKEIAGQKGVRIATHVAETLAEREFIAQGTGAHRRFLEELGLWRPEMLEEIGRGLSPVAHTLAALGVEEAGDAYDCTFVHVNDCSDADLEVMARSGVSVVYCPHASEYFGAAGVFGPHRYREMMEAGVTVALGTDSVINQPRGELSILAEMGLLYRRDGVDAATLLAMGTVNGAEALGMMRGAFEFGAGGDRGEALPDGRATDGGDEALPEGRATEGRETVGGRLAGLVAAGVDSEARRKHPDWHPLRWVLEREHPMAELLYIGTDYC
ncbi:MAG: amidohydrolase family protein [Tepidisphaera sp.]|nr:amidohydrolase family protein [Tepidisphaera sp.]